jgi:hypothetical protein
MADLAAAKALNGKRLLFVGDGMASQQMMAARCYFGEAADVTVDLLDPPMHIWPTTTSEFEARMMKAMRGKGYLAVVFAIGTWYNWDWDTTEDLASLRVGPGTTEDLLRARCPEMAGARGSRHTGGGYTAEHIKRTCGKHLLGLEGYLSGLMRFRESVEDADTKVPWPPVVVWNEVPPQHFSTPSGGFAEDAKPGCKPVADPSSGFHAQAGRNKMAYDVLDGTSGLHFGRISGATVPHWDMHATSPEPQYAVDCTHFCSPSPVTWSWVSEISRTIHSAAMDLILQGP